MECLVIEKQKHYAFILHCGPLKSYPAILLKQLSTFMPPDENQFAYRPLVLSSSALVALVLQAPAPINGTLQ